LSELVRFAFKGKLGRNVGSLLQLIPTEMINLKIHDARNEEELG